MTISRTQFGAIITKIPLKFVYSEKATTVDLSYVVTVKPTVEISQNFVTFSEYMNFTYISLSAFLGVLSITFGPKNLPTE